MQISFYVFTSILDSFFTRMLLHSRGKWESKRYCFELESSKSLNVSPVEKFFPRLKSTVDLKNEAFSLQRSPYNLRIFFFRAPSYRTSNTAENDDSNFLNPRRSQNLKVVRFQYFKDFDNDFQSPIIFFFFLTLGRNGFSHLNH